jgi:DNA polymerase-1
MRIIRTDQDDILNLPQWDREQVYNGLDVLITHDVHSAIHGQLDEGTAATYAFSKALQGPVLEMGIRGVLVDQARRLEVINLFADQIDQIETRLAKLVRDGFDLPVFNWRSPRDLAHLFYTVIGIRPIIRQGRPTVDLGAREKIATYPVATALISHINVLADLGKKLSTLQTEIDPDGRIRTSYNIAGTNTGRFSSSLSEFGTGGNLQNIEESLRSIFIADPGWKFAKCDAKSGESYAVGAIEWNLFGDGTYLDAVESGDVHTTVARMVWPELPWTGTTSVDKELAERPYYRGHSYRFMCKKLGHGSNYGGRAATLAAQSRIESAVVEEFQDKYFAAFPAHRRWQTNVDDQLRRLGYLVSLTARKRWFFGRRNDPSTLREAIAYDPQCSLADIVNRAMLSIWRQRIALIVMHDHDALTFMYREKDEPYVIPKLQEALVVPVPLSQGRVLKIPYDVETGWNKGHYHPDTNPDGLRPYRGADTRRRQPIRDILDALT